MSREVKIDRGSANRIVVYVTQAVCLRKVLVRIPRVGMPMGKRLTPMSACGL
jgi:hypothetical protein